MNPIDRPRGASAVPTQGSALANEAGPGEGAAGAPEDAKPAARLGSSGVNRAAVGAPLHRPAPTRAPPVHPADLEQAAYIVARQALGRPLTAESKNLLWTANETRKEVLELLPHGRGNIQSDFQNSDGESKARTAALRLLRGGLPTEGLAAPEQRAMRAAFAARAGAGNCAEFAEVSAHVHAGHLGDGDRIVRQRVDNLDHGWARVQCATPEGGEPRSGPAAVLDVWADGPIVEPADSRYGHGTPSQTNDSQPITSGDARAIVQAFEASRGPALDGHVTELVKLASEFKRNRTDANPAYFLDPIPVVSQGFADQAHNAILSGSPTSLRASAVAALLDAPAPLTREQAEANVDTVVALASNLDRPEPEARHVFRPIAED